ncbi:MAG: deoxyribonuclease IV [Candidatus Caldatribacteriota bacterium]
MKVGCHVSIARGIDNSVLQAEKLGCNAMQIFSKNATTWREKILDQQEVKRFKQNLKESSIDEFSVFIHASYLINLASPSDDLYFKSINSFIEELKRADILLDRPYIIIHPGAHLKAGEETGMQRIVQALNISLERSEDLGLKTVILLENTAGSGTQLGYRLEQLKRILDTIIDKQRMGICLDTCHAYAAGYDLSRREGIEDIIEKIDKYFGIANLKVIHINDSKKPLGSRKDRHTHIGQGYIGLEGFTFLINHPYLKKLPFILETPKNTEEDDLININLVKNLFK